MNNGPGLKKDGDSRNAHIHAHTVNTTNYVYNAVDV